MTDVLIKVVSLSVLGSVLAGLLLLLRPLFKDRVGKAFSYYLWIVVLLRLCLPLGVSVPAFWLAGTAQETASASTVDISVSAVPSAVYTDIQNAEPQSGVAQATAATNMPAGQSGAVTGGETRNVLAALSGLFKNPALWLMIWAAGSAVCLGWHALGYFRFTRAVRRTAARPNEEDLNIFREFPESGRIRFVQSAYVKTPMLIGLFRPTVVVPAEYANNGLSERLRDILRHELTHYRRRDLAYKWFAVFVTSLHWFNPLMFLVRREIGRACELACDEAVIRSLDTKQKQHYGETLLSLAASRPVPAHLLATTLCEEKARLKERLFSIMNYKTATLSAVLLSVLLLIALAGCAAFSGIDKTGSTEPIGAQEIADATLYEKYGLKIAIPNAYADKLLVFTEPKWEDAANTTLISVFEKKSYEDGEVDIGEDSYMGFLFSIVRYTQAQYEQFLCSDGSGLNFFAKDAMYYYGWATATDVQFYRSGSMTINTDSYDWKVWNELNENLTVIKGDFIARNRLTAYSDDEFRNNDFTYDGAHLYLTYYPYYAYQGAAEQQGFNWKDKAYTLVLSQPVKQGDKGIWCVERWYEHNGTLYYEFPYESGQSAADCYAALQSAADTGADTSSLDPVQAALKFVKTRFDHKLATTDSFAPIEGEPEAAPTGITKSYIYGNFEIKLTNVKSDRIETMTDDGGNIWRFNVITYYPGATLTVINADMSDAAYSADGKAHPQWGIFLAEDKRIKITGDTQPFNITSDMVGIYNLESSLYVFKFAEYTT